MAGSGFEFVKNLAIGIVGNSLIQFGNGAADPCIEFNILEAFASGLGAALGGKLGAGILAKELRGIGAFLVSNGRAIVNQARRLLTTTAGKFNVRASGLDAAIAAGIGRGAGFNAGIAAGG